MSFAGPKREKESARRRETPLIKKDSVIIDAPYSIDTRNKSTVGQLDMGTRIEILENNLNRVTSQQDTLLPLMNMLEIAPSVTKNDHVIKSLHKKSQETDERLMKMEQMVKSYNASLESNLAKISNLPKVPQFDPTYFDKSLKQLSSQLVDQQSSIERAEKNFEDLKKIADQRIQEENSNVLKIIEKQFDKQKGEWSHAVDGMKKSIADTLKKFDDALKELDNRAQAFEEFTQTSSKDKILDEINETLVSKFQEQLEFFREKYDKDIDNLYKDFGVIRCEMDILSEDKRQTKMAPHLQTLPKDAEPTERKIKLNNLEQSLNIYELDKFNKDNTQRIMYELQAFDEKLDQFKEKFLEYKNKAKNSQAKEEELNTEFNKFKEIIEIINEKYISLKYQIEGAKKKYFFDMTKIEDKMEKINQIKKEALEELQANTKLKRTVPQEVQTIDAFPDKIKNIMESINMNLETTFTRLEIVEEKIKENQDLMRK